MSIYQMLFSKGADAPAGAFESIASATGTGSSNTITFSSIPQTYQHLQIRMINRTNDSSGLILCRINGVTTTTYTRHRLYGDGASALATGTGSIASMFVGWTATDNYNNTNAVGATIMDIHDYSSTTKNKTIRSFTGGNDNDIIATTNYVGLHSGSFLSTNAVTSISIIAAVGSWTTQTQVALYGIKGA